MHPESRYDVIIAGAGPAGCAAAIILRQGGLSVCLVDNTPEGVPKLGESLPGAAVRLLHRLGIAGIEQLLPAADYMRCSANVSAWGSEQWTYQDALRNPEGGGWHLSRGRFDAALREKALLSGVMLCHASAEQVSTLPDEGETPFLVRLTAASANTPEYIRSQWLVDATGRRALLGRRLNLKRRRIDSQTAAVCWLQANDDDADRATRIKAVAQGWWYTALLPDNTRIVSFHSLPETIRELVAQPEDLLKKFNEADILPFPVEKERVISFRTTDAGTLRLEKASCGNLVCVGDAALSFDPLSSQGIYFALYSGIRGAEAILSACREPLSRDAALGAYQARVDQVFRAIQQSRRYFYTSEYRFASEPYWQSRGTGME